MDGLATKQKYGLQACSTWILQMEEGKFVGTWRLELVKQPDLTNFQDSTCYPKASYSASFQLLLILGSGISFHY
jgi:hypothetical protein